MAYIYNVPFEISFNTDSGIYVRYTKGSDSVYIGESLYKLSCLEELREILKDVLSIYELEKDKLKEK
jgi:hypothetical protein